MKQDYTTILNTNPDAIAKVKQAQENNKARYLAFIERWYQHKAPSEKIQELFRHANVPEGTHVKEVGLEGITRELEKFMNGMNVLRKVLDVPEDQYPAMIQDAATLAYQSAADVNSLSQLVRTLAGEEPKGTTLN